MNEKINNGNACGTQHTEVLSQTDSLVLQTLLKVCDDMTCWARNNSFKDLSFRQDCQTDLVTLNW